MEDEVQQVPLGERWGARPSARRRKKAGGLPRSVPAAGSVMALEW